MLQIEYLTVFSKTCKSSLIQKERKQLDFKRKLTFRSRISLIISLTSHHLKSKLTNKKKYTNRMYEMMLKRTKLSVLKRISCLILIIDVSRNLWSKWRNWLKNLISFLIKLSNLLLQSSKIKKLISKSKWTSYPMVSPITNLIK